MSEDVLQVSVRILDKDYCVACQPHEEEGLRDSARLLDQRMRGIYQTGRVIGTDRIAVIAALNLAHELIQLQRTRPVTPEETSQRLGALQARVKTVLAEQQPLDASVENS